MGALEEGLRHLANAAGNTRLGEGEVRRRKDLLATARKEKEGLDALSQAVSAKVRANNAMPTESDKQALVGATTSRSRRVLGKETDQTRELDNEGVLQLQRRTMQEQNQGVDELRKIIARQKELGVAINDELEAQNEMLAIIDDDVTRSVTSISSISINTMFSNIKSQTRSKDRGGKEAYQEDILIRFASTCF